MTSAKKPLFWDLAVVEVRKASADRGGRKRLALRAGVNESSLSRYLDGDNPKVPKVDDALRIARAAGVDLGDLLDLGDSQNLVADLASPYGEKPLSGVGAPLVAIDVAAGEGALPEVPDEKIYFFHESWMRERGWTTKSRDRFACVKLGSRNNAESMLPTIQPKSVLLIDRRADPTRPGDRAIWLVDEPEAGLCIKRVTLEGHILTLESDNPDKRYRPRAVSLLDRDIREVLRGRVLWYATEVV